MNIFPFWRAAVFFERFRSPFCWFWSLATNAQGHQFPAHLRAKVWRPNRRLERGICFLEAQHGSTEQKRILKKEGVRFWEQKWWSFWNGKLGHRKNLRFSTQPYFLFGPMMNEKWGSLDNYLINLWDSNIEGVQGYPLDRCDACDMCIYNYVYIYI